MSDEGKKIDVNWAELTLDKAIDFLLIFVGLYAAMSVERCQAEHTERDEYVTMLKDFSAELDANLAQEKSIEKDLGAIDRAAPPDNMGPMAQTFTDFFHDLEHDQTLVECLRAEFLRAKHKKRTPECHAAYTKFHDEHKKSAHHASAAGFAFRPAVLTPFYRYEIWQMYLAGGVKLFKNKDVAKKIGEVYNNAHLIERQVADIEKLYNDVFMRQTGRSMATDAELAEIIEDEEDEGELAADELRQLVTIDEALKDEYFEVVELQGVLRLQVERLKNTVLVMRREIEVAKAAIDEEAQKLAK